MEYRVADGSICGAQAHVIDFDDPVGNAWLAVDQFSVVEHKHSRRPDVMLFVDGLPLAALELKNATATYLAHLTPDVVAPKLAAYESIWASSVAI